MEREGASGWCQEGFGTEQFLDAGCGGNWPRGREAAGRRVGAAWPALANFFLFCGAMKGVRGSCAFFFWNPVCKVNVDARTVSAACQRRRAAPPRHRELGGSVAPAARAVATKYQQLAGDV